MKGNVYVDGLNLYYGALKNTENEDKLARQQIYWRALRTISRLEIIEGYFLEHKVRAKVVGTNEYVKIYKTFNVACYVDSSDAM